MIESLNALSAQFRCDTAPEKTNLMVGVFKSDNGGPHVLSSVSQVVLTMFFYLCQVKTKKDVPDYAK